MLGAVSQKVFVRKDARVTFEPKHESGDDHPPVDTPDLCPEDGSEFAASEFLQNELSELRTAVQRLRGDRASEGLKTAAELQALENRLRDLIPAVRTVEPHSNATDSLLPDLRNWVELLRGLKLTAAASEGEALLRQLSDDGAELWRQAVEQLGEQPNAEACFDALMRTTSMQAEALEMSSSQGEDIPLLHSVRKDLQGKLLAAIEREPPSDATYERWTTVLIDRCDSLLAALPDYSPERASAYLQLVADDVHWHLQKVEAKRNWRRRRLKRKLNRLHAEYQERVLQSRLERLFGVTLVAWFERLILVLIFAVLGLLTFEWVAGIDQDSDLGQMLILVDTGICAVFLWEFFFKFSLAPARWRWFYRHFLIDFLPSIPFGFIGMHMADPARAGRLARLLRLPRLARYVRVARPVIRMLRVFGFLTRGLDRLARQYTMLLNRNIILYPTREERQRALRLANSMTRQLRRLRASLNERWKNLLLTTDRSMRDEVARARYVPLKRIYDRGGGRPDIHLDETVAQAEDLPAELVLRQLASITAQDVEIELGDDLTTRLARVVRMLARPPIRWFPIIRSVVPRLSSSKTDAEIVADAARKLSSVLSHYHNRWFFFADLYGTITPSQFVDRLGTVLARSAFRPAYRLTLFGMFFLFVEVLLQFTRLPMLLELEKVLALYLGLPIIVLGVICYLIVTLGVWLQWLAREATEFFERAADAQFIALTETIRSRYLLRDARIFYRNVIRAERQLHNSQSDRFARHDIEQFENRIKQWLIGQHINVDGHAPFDPIERTVLLYRDSLDGALLTDSDTRTTNQLLGNPAMHRFRVLSWRFNRGEEKQLQQLDLQRQKSFVGPYVWFNLITRVVAHSSARLIIDYNRHAIPLAELPLATDSEKTLYDAWLKGETRLDGSGEDQQKMEKHAVTTALTELHFLDADPERDREVETRFGTEVLKRLKKDRRRLIRRIFGTYPFHLRLPKDMRVVNLHTLYENWLARGKALLLPLFLALHVAKQARKLWSWLRHALYEIRHPDKRIDPMDAAEADFATAVRKIERMRGPVIYACMKLRARLDPEYLGIPLPGNERSTLEGADFDADRGFLDLDPVLQEEILAERKRAEADMRRLGRLIDDGLLGRAAERIGHATDSLSSAEHVRAAAVAYLADFNQVRRHLSAEDILLEVWEKATVDDPLPMRPWPSLWLWWKFRHFCKVHRLKGRKTRKTAWRYVVHNFWDSADALKAWARHRQACCDRGEEILADLLRHPARISEILVTLRTIQTLALIDILNYRQHIYQLGEYAADGDPPDKLMQWGQQLSSPETDEESDVEQATCQSTESAATNPGP
ncbi:MAG: hypothetical protein KatS3mg105_4415 [Gemmatales bacterium]|nr:MAG: hypothetical protein KatS3mg105_4415 [Gemmatales bacterium]